MPLCLKSVSLLVLMVSLALPGVAQTTYPDSVGARVRYDMVIEMPRAYVSGILIMAREDSTAVIGSFVNEFGVSMIDFMFDEARQSVKLISVMKALDKWYVKRTLKADMRQVLTLMRRAETEYYNEKRKIRYIFTVTDATP